MRLTDIAYEVKREKNKQKGKKERKKWLAQNQSTEIIKIVGRVVAVSFGCRFHMLLSLLSVVAVDFSKSYDDYEHLNDVTLSMKVQTLQSQLK